MIYYGLETDNRSSSGKVTIEPAAQQHWIDIRHRSREAVQRLVAERTEACYGLLLQELMLPDERAKETSAPTR